MRKTKMLQNCYKTIIIYFSVFLSGNVFLLLAGIKWYNKISYISCVLKEAYAYEKNSRIRLYTVEKQLFS